MRILFLEPFFGGSHKDFALGFKEHSRYDVDLVTLPARFWKWRMRGAALHFLSQIKTTDNYDAIFATDMMDLTDFIGLSRNTLPPILLYFHENQLSYPLAPGEKRDFHMGFTNIVSAGAADRVMFNSRFHYQRFVREAGLLIERLPDFRPDKMLEEIQNKSEIAYPGCRFNAGVMDMEHKMVEPPLIIWNHRWEHDKNPESFFAALKILDKEDIPFSLAVLGENFEKSPRIFQQAREWFKDRIQVFGFLDSRQEYLSWLKKGSIVISCADQENFGISVVEAVRYGCLPLLPDRLSYPELIPQEYHSQVIYRSESDLVEKLKAMLAGFQALSPLRHALSKEMEQFAWPVRIKQYDDALARIIDG